MSNHPGVLISFIAIFVIGILIPAETIVIALAAAAPLTIGLVVWARLKDRKEITRESR